jgi:hypothetical protein
MITAPVSNLLPAPANASTAPPGAGTPDEPGAFGRELQRITDGATPDAAPEEARSAGKPAKRGAGTPRIDRAAARGEPANTARGAAGRAETSREPAAATNLDVRPGDEIDGAAETADEPTATVDLSAWMTHLLGTPAAPAAGGALPPSTLAGARAHPVAEPAAGVARAGALAFAPGDPAIPLPDVARPATRSRAARAEDGPEIEPGQAAAARIDVHALPRPALRADTAAGRDVAASTTSTAASVNAAIGLPSPPLTTVMPSAPAPTAPVEAALPAPLNSPEFAPALGTQIARFARDGIEHARLQLNPAEMGPIAVQVAMDGQQVRVDLVAEIAATRQALEQSLPALAGALRDAGFTLTGGGVFQHARDGSNAGDSRGAPPAPGAAALRGAEASDSAAESARAARTQGLVDLFA